MKKTLLIFLFALLAYSGIAQDTLRTRTLSDVLATYKSTYKTNLGFIDGSDLDTLTTGVYEKSQIDSIVSVLRAQMGSGNGIGNTDTSYYDPTNHYLIVRKSTVIDSFYTAGTGIYANLTDSLTAYYKLDMASLEAVDEISAFNLDYSNVTYQQAGKVNYSCQFNGTSSVFVATTAGNNPADSLTISVWVKTSTTGTKMFITGNYQEDSFGDGYGLFITTGNVARFIINNNTSGGAGEVIGTTNICDGAWHHIAGTWNGSTITLYVDGSSEGTPATWSNTITYSSATYNHFSIARTGDFSNFYAGYIDEVALWHKTYTSTDIQALYTKENSGNPIQ